MCSCNEPYAAAQHNQRQRSSESQETSLGNYKGWGRHADLSQQDFHCSPLTLQECCQESLCSTSKACPGTLDIQPFSRVLPNGSGRAGKGNTGGLGRCRWWGCSQALWQHLCCLVIIWQNRRKKLFLPFAREHRSVALALSCSLGWGYIHLMLQMPR